MSVAAVITEGYGSFGSIGGIALFGYFDSGGAAADPDAVSGRWLNVPTGRRSRKEIQAARERFGVIPKAVEKIINRVAVEQHAEPDDSVQVEALIAALERKNQVYKDLYAEVLKKQIRAEAERALMARDDEDLIFALLL